MKKKKNREITRNYKILQILQNITKYYKILQILQNSL